MKNTETIMSTKIKWGIIGLGKIAHTFAKDLSLVKEAELIAVASRSTSKSKKFGKTYNVKHTYGSYLDLFKCDEVNVIYIATPHTFHAHLAIEAMNYGKHVLCEKPMGVNTSEVIAMLQTAKKNQVFFMEGLWSRFNPTIQKVIQVVSDGKIGDLGYLNADFSFYALNREEEGRLLNPSLAGGSLLDIGIYPIFLSYLLLGMPNKIKASANFYKTGIEVQTSMLFEYDKAHAVLYSGLVSNSEMRAEISGSNGSIFIDPKWHQAQGYSVLKNGKTIHCDLPTLGNGYTYEIEEVHNCLQQGKLQSDLWSHQNSLDLITLLDNIRKEAKIVFPFEQ